MDMNWTKNVISSETSEKVKRIEVCEYLCDIICMI